MRWWQLCREFAEAITIDIPVQPVTVIRLKVPGSPDHATLMTDNQTEMRTLVVLYRNVGILSRNHLCLLARKRSIRQFSEFRHAGTLKQKAPVA
jgi:hypothetical protein